MSFLYIKDKRGQADTVFEVLIAVILLGFVLVAGTLAMSSLSNTKCSKSIDLAMSGLKQTIEKASTSALISTDFLLDVPYCFGSEFNISFGKMQNNSICSNYCPGSAGSCYLVKYTNQKDKVNPVRYTCVQISPIIQLNDDSCSSIGQGYNPVEQSSDASFGTSANIGANANNLKFTNGRYKIGSSSMSTADKAPALCIYKKVD